MPAVDWSQLEGSAVEVAPRLLGCYLVRAPYGGGQKLIGKIVETEAYDQSDAASHSSRGMNGRAAITFGPAGHLYVHASRHHFLCDITCGPEGHGSSVLIRAVEPLEGIEIMRGRRGRVPPEQLTNGPAKFCQAFAIDSTLNGHDLNQLPLQLQLMPPIARENITQATRIGITKDAHRLWRFYITNSNFISVS